MSEHDIPVFAKELAGRGQLVEAVKVTRERTGLSLKDAKNAVQEYLRNPHGASRFGGPRENLTRSGIPPQAIASLEQGQFLDAVKQTRAAHMLGLKAAKETVEHFLRQHPDIDARFRLAASAEFGKVAKKLATFVLLFGMLAIVYVYLQTE